MVAKWQPDQQPRAGKNKTHAKENSTPCRSALQQPEPVKRTRCCGCRGARAGVPANDTGRAANDSHSIADPVLRDALIHFARHGLNAPEQARREAMAAIAQGNELHFHHWLAICRKLDRRLANRLAKAHPQAATQD
jgi:hypothetical protein